ncbi:MAG: acyltransferase [Planctomycetota bacterium]
MMFWAKVGKALFRRFWNMLGQPVTARIPPSYFFINWFIQRIVGLNSEAPFQVHFTSYVSGTRYMKLGQSAKFCMAVSGCSNISAFEGGYLTIGEETIFARNICIRTANHDMFDRSKYIKADVTIGKNCWLGHGVAIMPGVTLGNNVTVGANAVVTKSFKDNVVIAGVPAKIIRHLDPNDSLSESLKDHPGEQDDLN